MMPLVSGILLALAGSGHCLGMCGPLALLAHTRVHRGLARYALLHHAGRVGTYLLLGGMAGATGGIIAAAGFRSLLAVAAGVALLANALGMSGLMTRSRWPVHLSRWMTARVSAAMATVRRHEAGGSLALGALNGLLPCGLLYAALAAAAGLGDARAALTFVAGFGLGSLPVFAGLTLSARAAAPWVPPGLRRAAPVALALVGLLLLARGLAPSSAAIAAHAHH